MIAGSVTMDNIREMFYPVGSVVMGDNLETVDIVKGIYGGKTWEQITGALYGIGDQITAKGEVAEQAPNVRGVYKPEIGIGAVNVDQVRAYGGFNHMSGGGTAIAKASSGSADQLTIDLSGGQTNSDGSFIPRANSVYKDGGPILVKGVATYAWKRKE